MTVNVIDVALHLTAFPTTYTGPGNLIGNPLLSPPGQSTLSLYFTGAGNVTNIPLGSVPVRITLVNITDNIVWEWFRGLPATNTIKTVSTGTRTVDTGSAIVVTTDLMGNATVSLPAATAVNSSAFVATIHS